MGESHDGRTPGRRVGGRARALQPRRARRPLMEHFPDRAAKGTLRWVATQFPTVGQAQEADMSAAEYADFVFAAGMLHLPDPAAGWRDLSVRQQRLVDHLQPIRELRFM